MSSFWQNSFLSFKSCKGMDNNVLIIRIGS
jgi:hypothetical protein